MTNQATKTKVGRRPFLKTAAAVAAASSLPIHECEVSAQEKSAADVVAGKKPNLTVHGAFPQVLETPPELLMDQITPLDVLFVRNNQRLDGAGTLEPISLDGWKIDVGGLVETPTTIDAAELAQMPQTSVEMVIQCCGNGRSLYASTVKAKGTQWTRGGMGNVKVTGVRLSDVLKRYGIKIQSRARFVTANGKDTPLEGKEDFQHSLPLGDTVRHSILALKFNDESIPAAHGGPVRLVTPGYFATMHMKWLTGLQFDARETDNYNQIPRYRTPRQRIAPGEPIKYTFANSAACWKMKVKSVILSPAPNSTLSQGEQLVRGVAFNDGQAKIESVLISTDKGSTWQRAKLEAATGPYAWVRWFANLKLPKGKHEIWSRAVDALGRSQPIQGAVAWNPSGYEWNGVEQVTFSVT